MELQITNIRGQIGIIRHDAVLSIRQPRPELEITTKQAELNIKTEPLKIKIDQSQCFSEAGLKGILELNEDYARMGKEAALEAIGRIVDEGNQMADIRNKSNAILEIAGAKALPDSADINVAFIPQSRPKIEWEGGQFSNNPVKGSVNIDVHLNPPEINATQPSLEIYLLQKPEFHMEFVGNNVDIRR